MTINYFDFGLHKGDEIAMFLSAVKPLKAKVRVFGFEPHPKMFQKAVDRYRNYQNVQIFDYAISNNNGYAKLYIAEGNKLEGNSIFKSKNNVDPSKYIEVKSIKFSDWIRKNIPNYAKEINVIRFNIEGAEIHLLEDIIEKELNKNIYLYLGASGGEDILKCKEISHLHSSYESRLKENGINVHQFCSVSQNNISSEKIISILKTVNNE